MTAVLIIIGFTIFMFIWEKIAIDITALITMALLMLSGVLTTREAISGFSNDAVITILFLYLLSAGLEKTGAVNIVGRWMVRGIGRSKVRAFLLIMLVCGFFSAFLNNTAVVIIFLPVIFKIARFTKQSPSRLLMPLSFAAIIGGTTTLIGTSTNLIVNEIAKQNGLPGFSMFEFTLIGVMLFCVFFIYMFLGGLKLIPPRRSYDDSLTENYELKDFLTEITIMPNSPFAGKRLNDTPMITDLELEVLEIADHKGTIWLPDDYETLDVSDRVLVRGSANDIMRLKQMHGVSFSKSFDIGDIDLKSNETALIEVVVGPNASIARSTFEDVDFRELYDAAPLALRRRGVLLNGRLNDIELRFGDDLLLEIKKDSFDQLQRSGDFIITHEIDRQDVDEKKVYIAFGTLAMVVILAATNVLPILESAIIGVICMFLFKLITIREAYREVDWRIIFILASLIPLGTAMEKTGAATLLAGYIKSGLAQYGPYLVLLGLYFITTFISSIMSDGATAVMLSPIAISLAQQMDVNPRAFLFAVMFAASTCYLTPIGCKTNMMIYGPGKYKFMDFVRVGGLLVFLGGITVSTFLYFAYF